MLNTVFFPARASTFYRPHVTCRHTHIVEMCTGGAERKGTRLYLTCVWAGRVPLWPSGYFFMAGRQNYSAMLPSSFSSWWYFKELHGLFHSVIWVIRVSYYLSHVSSAVFDALELPYVSTWCLSGTVGENGRSTLMPLMQENISLTQMAFL